MTVTQARLGVVTIFLLGGISGAAVTAIALRAAQAPPLVLQRAVNEVAGDLVTEVGLDAPQQAALRDTVADVRRQFLELRDDVRPRLDRILASGRQRIEDGLRADQKERFRQFIARRRPLRQQVFERIFGKQPDVTGH